MAQYNPYDQSSGGDPRGQLQNQAGYQQQRYESQQGPMANLFGYNAGRGSEADFGNYGDIMNRYRNELDSPGGGRPGPTTWGPSKISYTDPFKSYGGYEEFSKTGGYSRDDVANMRSRGVSPIRATYANAQREMGRQRSLQGGYSPNAFASQVKMAREQGQMAADATQNVEAGLAESRNKGRLAGLGGMSDIEKQRLAAELEANKFNATAEMNAAQSNAGAMNADRAQGNADRMNALQGMTSLYGTTPGQSQLFGNQLLQAVGQGGQFGLGMMGERRLGQALPSGYDQTMSRINTGIQTGRNVMDAAGTAVYPWLNNGQQQPRQGTGGIGGAIPNTDPRMGAPRR